jgi:hypothetical protein
MQQKLDVMVPTIENKNTTIYHRALYTSGRYVVLLKLCIYYEQVLDMIISSYIQKQRKKKKTKSVKLSPGTWNIKLLIHHSKN